MHDKNLTPHRAIWTLAIISAIVGCVAVVDGLRRCRRSRGRRHQGSAAGLLVELRIPDARQHGGAAEFASDHDAGFELRHVPAVRAELRHLHGGFHKHPKFNVLKHLFIPVFGLLANLACMAFYLVGPFMGYGTKMEPLLALGIALVWAIYGGIYFVRSSKNTGRTTLVTDREKATPCRLVA